MTVDWLPADLEIIEDISAELNQDDFTCIMQKGK